MRVWLAAAGAVPLVSAFAAPAEADPVQFAIRQSAAPQSFVLPTIPQFTSQSPVEDGMIAQEDVAPNAHVSLGLAPMLGRNIHSVRIEQEPVPTRNPGVTFVLKFPG